MYFGRNCGVTRIYSTVFTYEPAKGVVVQARNQELCGFCGTCVLYIPTAISNSQVQMPTELFYIRNKTLIFYSFQLLKLYRCAFRLLLVP